MTINAIILVTCLFKLSIACLFPSDTERSFNSIVQYLVQEKSFPSGDILDVGAHTGDWACMYACFDLERTVRAVDPAPKLVSDMKCPHKNMFKYNYVISNRTGYMSLSSDTQWLANPSLGRRRLNELKVEIQTLDNLFLDIWKSHPSFLHIDVEGYELEVLQGSVKIIEQFKPIFSIEIHVLHDKSLAVELILFAEKYNYVIYMVNEVCGLFTDCRNFICFPSEGIDGKRRKHNNRLVMRPALDLAVGHGGLVKVNHNNIFEKFEKYKNIALPWHHTDSFTSSFKAN